MELESAFRRADGGARFKLSIPDESLRDPGLSVLARDESGKGGFERHLRRLLDECLRPGDLFLDIGAHWGIHSLTAATRWPGQIEVLAFEPDPHNLCHLRNQIRLNGLDHAITAFSMAVGDGVRLAPLFGGLGTMGHSLYARNGLGQEKRRPEFFALTVPLDAIRKALKEASKRRAIFKIDVEGFECEVVAGAKTWLQEGQAATLILEKGRYYDREEGLQRLNETRKMLFELGFHLYIARPDGIEAASELPEGWCDLVFTREPLAT